MSRHVIIHASFLRREYFFSTDHCQGVKEGVAYPSGDFVPTTFHLPMSVAPRPSLPSGVCESVADIITIFHSGDREIPNPDPRYRVR